MLPGTSKELTTSQLDIPLQIQPRLTFNPYPIAGQCAFEDCTTVAGPHKSVSTCDVNQRSSKTPSSRDTRNAVSLCRFSAAIFCITLSTGNAEKIHTPAGLPVKSSPVNESRR